VKLLKPMYGVRPDGRIGITDLVPLSLGPERGSELEHFFPIADTLLTTQSHYIGTTLHALAQSIVPIIEIDGERVTPIGTGFFVSATGLLITAGHVVSAHMSDDSPALAVVLPRRHLLGESGSFGISIERRLILARKEESPLPFGPTDLKLTIDTDTAICQVSARPDGQPHQPLTIIQPGIRGTGLAKGKRASAVGYGAMGGQPFHLHASRGTVLDHYADNLSSLSAPTPGACFTASLLLPSGMSGSPIFDDEGIYVHGVVSRAAEGEPFGYGTMLAECLSVPIPWKENRSILQLMSDPNEGIIKFTLPGG
jgi:trypsin-like peptidase